MIYKISNTCIFHHQSDEWISEYNRVPSLEKCFSGPYIISSLNNGFENKSRMRSRGLQYHKLWFPAQDSCLWLNLMVWWENRWNGWLVLEVLEISGYIKTYKIHTLTNSALSSWSINCLVVWKVRSPWDIIIRQHLKPPRNSSLADMDIIALTNKEFTSQISSVFVHG